MTDYIKRADAIDVVLTYFIPRSHTGERVEYEEDFVRTIFKALPSADAVRYETTATINEPISIQSNYVYVVRCKDCRYGQYDATHYFCAEHHHKVYEDDYCSYGERRSNRGEEINGFKSVGQAWNTSQERREK